MSILVVGGAGYIGSHTVEELIKNNYDVLVIDNLQTGHIKSLPKSITFYYGDIRDKELVTKVFSENNITAVIHFAANLLVEESMREPLLYFNNNVGGMIALLEVMRDFKVKNLVFSSTAAVYGEPEIALVSEESNLIPKNPYGESKLMMEKIIRWCSDAYGINYVALRYFNVAGASFDSNIGEDHTCETHLIPIVIQVANNKREKLSVYGDDYPTHDGTCIRDYVHVVDLAKAHILAMEYINREKRNNVFNVGSSKGFSVLEIVKNVELYTGCSVNYSIERRRQGDPAVLIAKSDKIKEVLGWNPTFTNMKDIITSAWNWHKNNPEGFIE
ncbi:UDP-glucose 4-epimerase GalE [Streptococcus pseudoporcinus]|uniref:UDP-glucose 4-epimerase n=1 Tax=Streptococcus pseudoporcinus LQ 940-04 TaxID=875093 RepID=G5KAA2_9STRE|nr:UDP-glucose 4-epimerase GalE [Streptococcus pseudoporcinus]EFR43525.1 UDP-glucose 4-epimerase [Streptococcus pseudoporcinus SPIN 20026]EHI64879.1 UDP-glucose 4-epimerase [Streptococcus pseudoporcinus LQ 940-04]VEF93628.1 UDP-glucose 4-epimerase [Streptococcus pseudoporcinus]